MATQPQNLLSVQPGYALRKGCQGKEMSGKMHDSEQCVHHSCDLMPGPHGLLAFFADNFLTTKLCKM